MSSCSGEVDRPRRPPGPAGLPPPCGCAVARRRTGADRQHHMLAVDCRGGRARVDRAACRSVTRSPPEPIQRGRPRSGLVPPPRRPQHPTRVRRALGRQWRVLERHAPLPRTGPRHRRHGQHHPRLRPPPADERLCNGIHPLSRHTIREAPSGVYGCAGFAEPSSALG
jgi:hypothetical protein